MIKQFLYFIIFLILIKIITFIKYNLDVYKWHCHNIFPFDKYFTPNEKKYIDLCIKLSFLELLRPFLGNTFIYQLSYFSYSTEIKGNTINSINSSRIAYGTTVAPNYFYKYAEPILKERNIKLPINSKNYKFGGLGWDFNNKIFKIYFIDNLNLSSLNQFKNQGILSFSYNFPGELIEKKLYLYPKNNKNMTILFSKKRKEKQINVNKNIKTILSKINKTGKMIINKYKNNNYEIDTINYRNKDNFILYFPKTG